MLEHSKMSKELIVGDEPNESENSNKIDALERGDATHEQQEASSSQSSGLSRKAKVIIVGTVLSILVVVGILLIVFLVVLANDAQEDSRVVIFSNYSANGEPGYFLFANNDQGLATYTSRGFLIRADNVPGLTANDVTVDNGRVFTLDFNTDVVSQHQLNVEGVVSSDSTSFRAQAGAFNGLSAANSRLVVSGGNQELTVYSVPDVPNLLPLQTGAVDLGQGQPDVTLDVERPLAYVSTHFSGDRFGLTILDLNTLDRVATKLLLDDIDILPQSRAFSPNFPLRTAVSSGEGFKDVIAVAYLEGLLILNTSLPSNPQVIVEMSASELGFSPRAVTMDQVGNVFAVGPEDRSNFNGFSNVGGYSIQTAMQIPPFSVSNGVIVSSIATSDTTIAMATRNGPIFVPKLEVLPPN